MTVGRFLIRLGLILGSALLIGSGLSRIAHKLDDNSERPAGFARGMAQGALMPLALPNLLVGHDMAIYSTHNNGTNYKLGYTVGVNGCGAIFFGFCFWRLLRLRRRLATRRENGEGAPVG
jgi:hypothetical protein